MSQKYLLLSPRDESRSSKLFHFISCPFGDSPKRTNAGFDCKVKRPAVNLERQFRRHPPDSAFVFTSFLIQVISSEKIFNNEGTPPN